VQSPWGVCVTTTNDDVEPESMGGTLSSGPLTGRSVRELIAELARAEDALRRFPDDPDVSARLRRLVRELRRRRARGRLQSQMLEREAPGGWSL
jgi:hypothetical protein